MRFLVLTCAALFSSALLAAQTSSSPAPAAELKRQLDQHAPAWLQEFHVTSASVAYIDDGKIAWTAYYGNQVPGGPPANEKTLYNVASLTKPVTAEVLVRLASEKKLSLDEPISPFWIDPDIKENPWTQLLTPRICLSHQTGFTNWRYQTKGVLTFQWEPGTKTGYSGEGFDYVARFAEKKTGQPWETLAQHYVFDEIGMRDTSYTPRDWWTGRQAKPVEAGDRTKWSAADLLRTTVNDYAKFIISVMRNEHVSPEIARQRLTMLRNNATPEMVASVCKDTPDAERCSAAAGFGLSWQVLQLNDEMILDHSGSDPDVKTLALFLPARKSGIVIFTGGPDIDNHFIRKVVSLLYPNPIYLNTIR
jgi:CubicO group peptidase (beta-lactamase class C family)